MARHTTTSKKRFMESEENLKRIEKIIEPFTGRKRMVKHEFEGKWNVTSNTWIICID